MTQNFTEFCWVKDNTMYLATGPGIYIYIDKTTSLWYIYY